MGEADPELGIEASSELHLEAVSLALEYIDSGHAHCLGEVGSHITQSEKKFGKEQMIYFWKFSLWHLHHERRSSYMLRKMAIQHTMN